MTDVGRRLLGRHGRHPPPAAAPGRLEDQTVVLRLLSDRRDDLVAERTRTLSRLHVLLADLHPAAPTGS